LFRIVTTLEAEASAGYPNGALYWSSSVDALIRRLAMGYVSGATAPAGGIVSAPVLKRLDDYINGHLSGSLDLDTLASVAGVDRFHFAHRFSATVGMSPHRYVMRLRLERARDLISNGTSSLADVALEAGFTDQSHLARWVRRVYNRRPTEFRV
jgi:AraC family transcriptional regulator